MRKLIEKVKASKVFGKVLGAMLMAQSVIMGCPMVVRANGTSDAGTSETEGGAIGQTKLVQGFLNLITDVGVVLLIIEAVLVGVLCGWQFICMQQADETEKPKHKKNIKTILITGVLCFTITGLIEAILSYFK